MQRIEGVQRTADNAVRFPNEALCHYCPKGKATTSPVPGKAETLTASTLNLYRKSELSEVLQAPKFALITVLHAK